MKAIRVPGRSRRQRGPGILPSLMERARGNGATLAEEELARGIESFALLAEACHERHERMVKPGDLPAVRTDGQVRP